MSEKENNSLRVVTGNAMMLYIRMFLVMGVGLFTSRIVLRQLGVVDYGIFNVVGGVVVVFSFLNGAMATATQRFLSFEIGRGDAERLEKTFKTALTVHLLIGVVFLLLAETVGLWFLNNKMTIPAGQLQAANWVYQFAIASFIVYIMLVPFDAAVVAHERMKIYACTGMLEVLLRLGVAFSLSLFTGEKLKYFSMLVFFVAVIQSLAIMVYSHCRFKELKIGFLFEKEYFRPMAGFASWSTIGGLAWIGRTQGCNIILNLFYGPVVNAAYGISSQVNSAVNKFVQNFTVAMNPRITKSYSMGEEKTFEILIMQGSKFSFFLLLLLIFPILMTTRPILEVWLGEVPQYAVVFIKLILINSLIESVTFSMGAGMRAVGRVKWYEVSVGCTLLLSLPIAYMLLKRGYEPYIIFVINIILSVIAIGVRLVLMRIYIPAFSVRKFVMKVFLPTGYVAAVCCTAYLLFQYFNFGEDANPFLTIGISLIVVLCVELTVGLTGEERKMIVEFVRSQIYRKRA